MLKKLKIADNKYKKTQRELKKKIKEQKIKEEKEEIEQNKRSEKESKNLFNRIEGVIIIIALIIFMMLFKVNIGRFINFEMLSKW